MARWAVTARWADRDPLRRHISPGDGTIGTLTLKRYLNFVGESFYDVDIAGDGRSDQLLVSGKTTISDQAKVQVTALDPQTSYKTGQSYRILTSDGGIDGQFAGAISKSAFLDVALKQSTELSISPSRRKRPAERILGVKTRVVRIRAERILGAKTRVVRIRAVRIQVARIQAARIQAARIQVEKIQEAVSRVFSRR